MTWSETQYFNDKKGEQRPQASPLIRMTILVGKHWKILVNSDGQY